MITGATDQTQFYFGLAQQLVGGANLPFCFELADCLVVFVEVPVALAVKLADALFDQGIFPAFFFGELATRRAWRWYPSRAGFAPASMLADGHRSSRWQPSGCQIGCCELFSNADSAGQPAGSVLSRRAICRFFSVSTSAWVMGFGALAAGCGAANRLLP